MKKATEISVAAFLFGKFNRIIMAVLNDAIERNENISMIFLRYIEKCCSFLAHLFGEIEVSDFKRGRFF